MYIVTFKDFLLAGYMANEHDWNPNEHEAWELPPLGLFREFLRFYSI